MQHLGKTRSAHHPDHLLQTPDTFVRAPLPGMRKATAIVHIGPAGGARFTQYTAEFETGGTLEPASVERFVYVLEGELTAGQRSLAVGDYAYFPPSSSEVLSAARPARAAIVEKPYVSLGGASAPALFTGKESMVNGQPFMGDDALQVRTLVPADPAFDFAVNTMTFQPGATLPMVEIHVMEHGLLMLAGEGIYRLGEHWYPVSAGDFIWMGPYCPQWFGALGKTPAKYLIYKDWNRHPLAGETCS
ncbi:MAG: Cupin 2, conserved barrel domain protein [Bryobacterales bacterium]|nr:Cupin 2, conserved barrel domain protein [Bryobacterales bacterium]